MEEMNELAEHFEKKSRFWSIVFFVVKWPAFLNILLFLLYCVSPIKGPFTLIFGTGPANLWFSIGLATVCAIVLFISYHGAHECLALSKRAREESSGKSKKGPLR